jgi:hypothetical protein
MYGKFLNLVFLITLLKMIAMTYKWAVSMPLDASRLLSTAVLSKVTSTTVPTAVGTGGSRGMVARI